MKFFKKFLHHTDYVNYMNSQEKITPNLSFCDDNKDVHFNQKTYENEYMTTIAKSSGTISFNIWKTMGTDMITSISYSTDNGTTWNTIQNQNNKESHLSITVNVNSGTKIKWKGIATQLGCYDDMEYDDYVGSFFSSTCDFDAKGNIMSLLYGDNFIGETTLQYEAQFAYLFCDYNYIYDSNLITNVVNIKDLVLPATTLSICCYYNMFTCCTSLINANITLPATTLSYKCYYNMFSECSSLTVPPKMLANTLAPYCCQSMFSDCISLVTAPELPATTTAINCYSDMFMNCSSLVVAPELPATTIEEGAYQNMFMNCTSLTKAVLPATTLNDDCYLYMFFNCHALNYIKAMFTESNFSSFTINWVTGVSSTGTFVKSSAAQWDNFGIVPNGWTVETVNE